MRTYKSIPAQVLTTNSKLRCCDWQHYVVVAAAAPELEIHIRLREAERNGRDCGQTYGRLGKPLIACNGHWAAAGTASLGLL